MSGEKRALPDVQVNNNNDNVLMMMNQRPSAKRIGKSSSKKVIEGSYAPGSYEVSSQRQHKEFLASRQKHQTSVVSPTVSKAGRSFQGSGVKPKTA